MCAGILSSSSSSCACLTKSLRHASAASSEVIRVVKTRQRMIESLRRGGVEKRLCYYCCTHTLSLLQTGNPSTHTFAIWILVTRAHTHTHPHKQK